MEPEEEYDKGVEHGFEAGFDIGYLDCLEDLASAMIPAVIPADIEGVPREFIDVEVLAAIVARMKIKLESE